VKLAISKGEEILSNNFTTKQTEALRVVANQLEDLSAGENAALRMETVQKGNNYQPSWKLLEKLQAKGFITEAGQWSEQALVHNCTVSMLQKCKRISAMKKGPVS